LSIFVTAKYQKNIPVCNYMVCQSNSGKFLKTGIIFFDNDELPLTLTVEQVGKVLGISRTKAYELVHAKDFPTIRIGKRLIISKFALVKWIQENGGAA